MTRPVLPLHLVTPGFAALAAPFVQAGALGAAEAVVVDRLASLANESDARVLLGLAFAVRAATGGSVGVDLASLQGRVEVALAFEADGACAAPTLPWPEAGEWQRVVAASALVCRGLDGEARPFVAEGGLVLPRRYAEAQHALAGGLVARLGVCPGVGGAPLDEGVLAAGLQRLFPPASGADDQRAAAEAGVRRGLTVVTGGPGTGKTFAIKNVLALLADQWQCRYARLPRVALAAPTGKAAWRMTQALREGLERLPVDPALRGWLGSLDAVTLHRLLGARLGGQGFRHGAAWPLAADVVVVDEASMVDLALMQRLVAAVPSAARLVLAGDPDQLASVGVGSVLSDLVRGLPRAAQRMGAPDPLVRLHRARRFDEGSGVAHLARALADDGDAGRVVDWLVNGTGPDGRPLAGVELHPLVEGRLPEAVLTSVVDATIRRLGPLLEAAPPAEGRTAFLQARLDDLEAFRVLAVHRAGALGVEGLTRNLLAALRERLPTRRFDGATWPGRPVLVTENRYDLDLRNGDVGLIVTGADGDRRAVFPSLGGSELRELAASRLPAHESAFVHTVHRAQGSQYPTVVVVLPAQASPLLTRELVYTAITRARSRLVLAADPAVLRQALSQRVERASTLAEGLSRHATR